VLLVFKTARRPTGWKNRFSKQHLRDREGRFRVLKCVQPQQYLRILFVGSERPEEFREALKFRSEGHAVLVVNPRASDSARNFQLAGGRFLRARVEELVPLCGGFDLIYENYPYPSGKNYIPPKPFVLARLQRLAPGGQWILHTEAVRFATLLKGVVDYDLSLVTHFRVSLTRIPLDDAPPSDYPATGVRYRLIFRRRY